MNHQYRKKPVVIEAFQITEDSLYGHENWPKWLKSAWDKGLYELGSFSSHSGSLNIETLEGELTVSINDYIIQGVNGEIYPCKPDIFEKTYDKVILEQN